jgi:hypothetical protein
LDEGDIGPSVEEVHGDRVAQCMKDQRAHVRLGRRESCPSRPPTPPCVRVRTRRFTWTAAWPGVDQEGFGVPMRRVRDC